MTVTTRLTAHFSVALMAALSLSSILIFCWAQRHSEHEIDLHLASAMNTLQAAAEIEPSGVEWDRQQRKVSVRRLYDQPIVWCVLGPRGELIDHSGPDAVWLSTARIDGESALRRGDASHWQIESKRLEAPRGSRILPTGKHFESIELRAAIDTASADANLRRLAVALLSSVMLILLIWALIARRVCRRALRPLTRMAAETREIAGDDPESRLSSGSASDELSALADAFNALLERQQQARQRLQNFATHASHQLRNPLAGLLGQLEVALRHPRTADEYHSALVNAHLSGSQLQNIVDALLRLTRNDHRDRCHWTQVDVGKTLVDWRRAQECHQRFRDLRVQTEEGIVVTTDSELLRQILDILFDNAVKYSPAHTPVSIQTEISVDCVRIRISNQSEPIPDEVAELIFTPFFRAPQAIANGVTGTGLGLAIASQIATVIGASIQYCPQRNEHVEFMIEWPDRP